MGVQCCFLGQLIKGMFGGVKIEYLAINTYIFAKVSKYWLNFGPPY